MPQIVNKKTGKRYNRTAEEIEAIQNNEVMKDWYRYPAEKNPPELAGRKTEEKPASNDLAEATDKTQVNPVNKTGKK